MRRDIVRKHLWPSGVIFMSLLAFWLILSGHFDALHITYGVISAGIVVVLTRGVARLGQIILANLQIAAVILHRRRPISPTVVRLRTRLRGDLGGPRSGTPSPSPRAPSRSTSQCWS